MGWKCTPQVTGLVRGEAKQGQKHRSNVKAIVAEAGKRSRVQIAIHWIEIGHI